MEPSIYERWKARYVRKTDKLAKKKIKEIKEMYAEMHANAKMAWESEQARKDEREKVRIRNAVLSHLPPADANLLLCKIYGTEFPPGLYAKRHKLTKEVEIIPSDHSFKPEPECDYRLIKNPFFQEEK